jgi:hypothetical protein
MKHVLFLSIFSVLAIASESSLALAQTNSKTGNQLNYQGAFVPLVRDQYQFILNQKGLTGTISYRIKNTRAEWSLGIGLRKCLKSSADSKPCRFKFEKLYFSRIQGICEEVNPAIITGTIEENHRYIGYWYGHRNEQKQLVMDEIFLLTDGSSNEAWSFDFFKSKDFHFPRNACKGF